VLTVFIRDVIEPLAEKFPTPEGEIREWVGHADSKMVEHYRHLGCKDAVRRMEQISFVDPDADEQERSGQDK
jgi:hypothetical protein